MDRSTTHMERSILRLGDVAVNWARGRASTIAERFLAAFVRATRGCEVRWIASGLAGYAAPFATDGKIAGAGRQPFASLGRGGVKTGLISDAARGRIRRRVTSGESL